MNLPGFKKGDVLRAAELQALSDAVARFREAGRAVAAAGGAAAWQNGLRVPVRESGMGRPAVGFDRDRSMVNEVTGRDCALGRPLVAGFGFFQGPGTEEWMQQDCVPCLVECTVCGWRGSVWQSVAVRNDGTAVNITKPFKGVFGAAACCRGDVSEVSGRCERPIPSRWWGDDGQSDGTECGGQNTCGQGRISWLIGCMRENVCTREELRNVVTRSFWRKHELLPVPHLAFNAPGGCGAGLPLVKHVQEENVSRVRRLKAGENVQLVLCEDFVRVDACSGGGLRPVNPPGVCCGEDVPSAGCCELPRPVPMVGCEWPAGAPTGVMVRALVGGAAARVRRSCCACAVEVVVPRVQNADAVGGCLWLAGTAVRPVTCCALHSCCAVPLRVLDVAAGMCALPGDRSARLGVFFPVRNCTAGDAGDAAEPEVDGWRLGLSVPGCELRPGACCGCEVVVRGDDVCGALRQLLRFRNGELQVVQQVKQDGVWQGVNYK